MSVPRIEPRVGGRSKQADPVLAVITGDRGAGKTTLCTVALRYAEARGLTVAGLLSLPHESTDGSKWRRVLDISSGEWRVLGRFCPHRHDNSPHLQSKAGGPSQAAGRPSLAWEFCPEAIRWADARIARCTAKPPEVLIVDEIGPLELVTGQGWGTALPILAAGCYRLAIAVVRPWLLPSFSEGMGTYAAIQTLRVSAAAAARAAVQASLCRLIDEL